MQEENKVFAEEKGKLEKLSEWSGIVPGQHVFATPPIFKKMFPEQRDKWPVFKTKPTDGLDFNQDLDRDEIYDASRRVMLGKIRIHKLKRGVKDWKNFPFENPIPCPKDADGNITDEAIRAMPVDLQNWLFEVIDGAQTISQEESDGLKF